MKYAADFRSIARNALSGRWTIAVLTGFVASLVGAVSSGGPEINLNFGDGGPSASFEVGNQQIYTFGGGWDETLTGILIGGAAVILVVALVVAVAYLFLGSVTSVGYARFNLDMVDRQKEPEINTMFSYFKYWKTLVAANLLRGLIVFLWTLLFIIPGIIAAYGYKMTDYILAEHPELTAGEALERSKQMMEGNRFRLFCLEFSFVGWDFLCLLTLGIGNLWLMPYKQAAAAAFYREVSGTEYIVTPVATYQD